MRKRVPRGDMLRNATDGVSMILRDQYGYCDHEDYNIVDLKDRLFDTMYSIKERFYEKIDDWDE